MQQNGMVLLIENNPDDARLAQIAFERAHFGHLLNIVADGAEAMNYLKAEGTYADRAGKQLPRLILLDLAMPGVSGLEFLELLRREPELRHIPVAVLSGSSYSPDVQRAYNLGAKSFLEKPCDMRKFSGAIKELIDAWVVSAPSLPPRLRLSYI